MTADRAITPDPRFILRAAACSDSRTPFMTPSLDDLLVRVDGDDPGRLLTGWKWLLGDRFRPLFATALGDLFLTDSAGRIHWLDVCRGIISEVAQDGAEFQERLADRRAVNEWFCPALVAKVRAIEPVLEPGECYGYKLPPVVGGEMVADNFEPTDLDLHFGLLGQLHEGARGQSDGTPISRFRDV